MSYAIIKIIYGVPLTEEASNLIDTWEKEDKEDWFEDDNGTCGFNILYSASGPHHRCYCGVELDELTSYGQDLVANYKFSPTDEQAKKAEALVASLHPELRELAGSIGVYFIWYDS